MVGYSQLIKLQRPETLGQLWALAIVSVCFPDLVLELKTLNF